MFTIDLQTMLHERVKRFESPYIEQGRDCRYDSVEHFNKKMEYVKNHFKFPKRHNGMTAESQAHKNVELYNFLTKIINENNF